VEQSELERTLNMGVGMVAVVDADAVDPAVRLLADQGVDAWVCGETVPGDGSVLLEGSYA
jgi:phosphoribosylformylglycinamidine cyclo-ligase